MIDVLYIEDDANDADIFTRLMHKMGKSISYQILSSGSEAVDYLTGKGNQRLLQPLPKLLLLDLNLVGMSGVDVIRHARESARTRFLPIVVFSTSDRPSDVQSAYEAGINAYLVKPGSYGATGTLLNRLCDFWIEHNTRIDS